MAIPDGGHQEGLFEGLCRVLSNAGRSNAGARLQALHHINALSTHSDATRNSVTTHVLVPLIAALADPDVSVHCEAASAVGNLVHGSPARAAQLMEAGIVWPLMNLLRERQPTTLSRAALALGALLRASVPCRQQLEVTGRETLLPLMLSQHASVCDAAEYAILGLYGGGDDPAQAMALRAQVAALRASKESMFPHPATLQTCAAVQPTYATPHALPQAYEYAVLHLEGGGACEHVHAKAVDGGEPSGRKESPGPAQGACALLARFARWPRPARAAAALRTCRMCPGSERPVSHGSFPGELGDVKTERKTIRSDEYMRLVSGWMLANIPPVAAEALAEPPREGLAALQKA